MKRKQLINTLYFSENIRKYIFKCTACNMILSADIEEEDCLDIVNNDFLLECVCGADCTPLLD